MLQKFRFNIDYRRDASDPLRETNGGLTLRAFMKSVQMLGFNPTGYHDMNDPDENGNAKYYMVTVKTKGLSYGL